MSSALFPTPAPWPDGGRASAARPVTPRLLFCVQQETRHTPRTGRTQNRRVLALQPTPHRRPVALSAKKAGYTRTWCNLLFCLARPRGIEPLTKSLEGSCSILLSYGRMLRMPKRAGTTGLSCRHGAHLFCRPVRCPPGNTGTAKPLRNMRRYCQRPGVKNHIVPRSAHNPAKNPRDSLHCEASMSSLLTSLTCPGRPCSGLAGRLTRLRARTRVALSAGRPCPACPAEAQG